MKNYIKYICLFLAIVGMSLGSKLAAETQVAQFASGTEITSDTYQEWDNTNWYLSMGGAQKGAGFNAKNWTTIGNAYGTSANTSHHGFYILSKNKLANVCKITFGYDFCSTATECANAKIYLGYSTDGSSWNAISLTSGSQGTAISPSETPTAGSSYNVTTWTFEFEKIASAYYAIIISRNGSMTTDKGFRFDDATVTFYSGCCTELAKPTGLTVTQNVGGNHGKTTWSWNAVSHADSYELSITKNGTTTNTYPVASTSKTGTISAPGNYTWSVSAVGSGDYCKENPAQDGTPFCIGADLTEVTPSGLSATPTSTSAATISWNSVSGAEYYEVEVKVDGGATVTSDIVDGTSWNATGLSANTTYRVFWKADNICDDAYNSDVNSSYTFTITAHTVQFNLNGKGSGKPSNQTILHGGKATTPTPPTAPEGWGFAGWYKEEACTNAWNFGSDVVNADVTLYAKWSEKRTLAVASVADVVISAISPSVAEGSSTYVTPGTTVTLTSGAVTSPKSWAGWNVYKTGDESTKVTVTTNTFTMPDYNVTVSAYLFGDLRAFCEPEVEITITGDVWLTSYAGVNVFTTNESANLITIDCDDFGDATRLGVAYLHNGTPVTHTSSPFRLCWYEFTGKSDYNLVDADGSAGNASPYRYYPLSSSEKTALGSDQTFAIRYNPGAGVYNQEDTYTLRIAALDDEGNDLGHEDLTIHGRALPQYFAIASKYNNKWYALPNTIVSNTASVTPIEVTVDNTTTPTAVTYAPTTVKYKGGARNTSTARRYAIGLYDPSDNKLKTVKDKTYVYLGSDGSTKYQDWYLESTDFGAYTLWVPSDDSEVTPKKMGISSGKIGYFGTPESPSEQIYLLPVTNWLTPNDAKVTEWGQKSVILDVDAQSPIASAQAHFGNRATAETTTVGQTLTSVKESATKYNYTLTFSTTDFSTHKGELLYIDWLDGESSVLSTSTITIPWIIATDTKMTDVSTDKDAWAAAEVHVLPGVTLEANGGDFSYKTVAIKQLEIYPGATVKITKGNNDKGTLNPTTLVLRNGWTRAGSKEYNVARLYITDNGTLTKPTNTYSDWYIDFDQYYPVAVPWSVTTSGMSYKNSNSAASAGVKMRYYDGASRADNGQTGVANGANWKEYSPLPATLTPGLGYAMTAKRPTGKAFSIIRMPLTIPSSTWMANGEQGTVGEAPDDVHKDQVTVTAHGDENTPSYAQGWNLIANPYMSLHQGALNYTTSGNVMYANIPDINFTEYDQVPIATTKLKPSSAFLIQAPKDGTVTFGTTNRKASAPSYRNTEATIPTQQAYILVGNEEVEDMMGILVNSKYTAEYEVNADLEKLLSDGNTLRAYMLYNNMNMAYLAINEVLAKELIPVAVRIPADGEYTFKMHEASVADELEGVYLTDYETGNVTNLLYDSYTFNAVAGTDNVRFAINAVIGKREVPTGVDISDNDKDRPTKFIWNDKVYILHNNVIYDSTGKRVNVINK